MKKYTIALLLMIPACKIAFSQKQVILSPDKKIAVTVSMSGTKLLYQVAYNKVSILEPSGLGLILSNDDFYDGLHWDGVSQVSAVRDNYHSLTAKKSTIIYNATRQSVHVSNGRHRKMDIIFQVSNDGVAFRYYFPQAPVPGTTVLKELTSYRFDPSARAWLQPMDTAKTGWEHTQPSYEEFYEKEIAVGTPVSSGVGWVYPALFKSHNVWMLISEAAMDGNWCGTRLVNDPGDTEYRVAFPDAREIFPGGGMLPVTERSAYSPWRVMATGTLKTIVESTLGTDVATPAISADLSFVKPGKASWSWIMSKDDFIVYDEQKKYIDFAADMKWQYCLIDVNWDQKIGYAKIKELADYAAAKHVGLILWYNSAGDWNTVKYTPKGRILTPASRKQEFARLQQMGIKGVKIDFFGGDGQSVMAYYNDILKDAARYKLLVNFHGATLPRGWSRTYPNLVTTEAVRGFEMVTFEDRNAAEEAGHCSMLPFTRNAFDPMDFTPMNLHKIQSPVIRQTTSAFELATAVLFISGIQHYAESPEGMAHVPPYVKEYLRKLPDHWDDVRFIDGYPGKLVIIARRSGTIWYVAGINGEKLEKALDVDLSFIKAATGMLITDGEEPLSFKESVIRPGKKVHLTLKPNGGFSAVFK